ncbi:MULTISPECIES: DUF1378 family protein [unclassified Tatumella]|uniref:DUF1378 family protein n=1 Tax=unclassified Tatumella TaxID=2649542 RepID=UPI001BAFFFA6|nr:MULTISPECIES: DUF1378 family protein [unclassified Tatumella]MBS0878575.1 DUF1378 family protein [Tatumella sp. JGM82]MBS0892072.1 DUF1378 family protein [Tatumella sp. JGM94]MBS0900851.1 DUF1378 family protein [Tatumella sp. JGM100]
MTIETLMLYFSTAVSALYLAAGGYKVIRTFIAAKFESAVAEKAAASAASKQAE